MLRNVLLLSRIVLSFHRIDIVHSNFGDTLFAFRLVTLFFERFCRYFVEVVGSISYRFPPHTRYFVIPSHTPISHSPALNISYTDCEITAVRFDI